MTSQVTGFKLITGQAINNIRPTVITTEPCTILHQETSRRRLEDKPSIYLSIVCSIPCIVYMLGLLGSSYNPVPLDLLSLRVEA